MVSCVESLPRGFIPMEAGEILLRRGLIDERQLALVRQRQLDGSSGDRGAGRSDQVAIELGMVSEEAALRALGDAVGLEYIDLADTPLDLSRLKSFPLRLMHRQSLFPIRRENGTLVVATCDPFDLYPLDE